MEDYNLAMFTHAMDFFKECASLKKSIPKHFFTNLLNIRLGNPLQLVISTIHETQEMTICNLGRQAWVPQEFKNKVLNHPMNRRM
jgi:hypothetical protein